jgi:D-amino peptidase
VPTVLISGDRAAVREAEAQVPGIRGVVVKEGISRIAANSVHPEVSRQMIREGVQEALARRDEIQPLRVQTPVRLEFDAYFSVQADAMALVPTVERLGDRTVAFESPDPVTAYRTFVATYYLHRAFG